MSLISRDSDRLLNGRCPSFITEAAAALGVSRKTLSELLNGHTGISPEMAVRLSIAFDTTPESWLTQQMQYDLWKLKQSHKKFKVEHLMAA